MFVRYGSDLLATAIPRRRSKFACLEKGDAMFGYGAGQRIPGPADHLAAVLNTGHPHLVYGTYSRVDLRFSLEYQEYVKAAGPPPHTAVSKWFCLRLLIADKYVGIWALKHR
ncbi:uncharacterized protein Bfra_009540 [Botrytis fragariae]|uniref:Uncharacterized protein n=1 Tax=Botrytis fragariae TaxID=1964551 RepID=A0A8H6ANP0_9HELO|nr:uncharacterized protein Bfra_009540 [Botrytis fragariae]KAF5870986.1 hypothetical protein Bfra_009540 [Botrytis fragariae]